MSVAAVTDSRVIRQVWKSNLEEAFKEIGEIIESYPYVALDTEFPGIVARPITHIEYNYQTVKCNVDLLNVIQLGFTFANGTGEMPRTGCTWQFNFQFSLAKDVHAQDSIEFLTQNGVDFASCESDGINPQKFGALLVESGLIMSEDIRWVSFHGCYDFGYLLKIVTGSPLPHTSAAFKEKLADYFPCLYDIKYLLEYVQRDSGNVQGDWSLRSLCEHLEIMRVGQEHQAGSDSLATSRAFFKLIAKYFKNKVDDSRFAGALYGIQDSDSRLFMMKPLSAEMQHLGEGHVVAEHGAPISMPEPKNRWMAPSSLDAHGVAVTSDAKKRSSPLHLSDRLPPGMLRLRPSQIAGVRPAHTDCSGDAT
eukprot:Gregarina_sp_Poly_1__727@NODE_1173_length_4867_cov_47_652708_g804_i0_p2_GENE_NODE_1173_length_4867_cov_47_652708_g804_i0NODE_1173_length_4867_cov_47_652708_g804_i0_p2_ORF_typecomplete_len364_score49_38CAF1/PF04857_20/4_6e46RNase_T/PF00929_24/0_026DNA_pol_A_exo1/PF01612_20/11DNA_pol_A_exo1/PF01612_20/38_NODE_1173_length_4867_cov_47_652708_g804_i06171708